MLKHVLIAISLTGILQAQNSLSFSSVDSLFNYAEKHSYVIRTGDQQSLLAKWTKISSYFNTVNIKSPFTASWTDNTKLPVSYLPAEVFGGPAGQFKSVTLGQQYVSIYGITPQIDIINPANWARIKSAGLNKQLTQVNNQINKKNLFESISAAYCNIISMQYQIAQLEKHLEAADSLLLISENKFSEGLIRQQDLNNMKVNQLAVQDKLQQLRWQLEQNTNTIKILCDIKHETSLQFNEQLENANLDQQVASKSLLVVKQAQLQSAFMRSELNATRLQSFAPTLSLVFNQSWQENSNKGFFDANANKFTSQYIGVRLSFPFPLDPSRLAQNYTARINSNMAAINALHNDLQKEMTSTNLEIDQQRSSRSYIIAKEISEIKDANYLKSLEQYKAGILQAEILLSHFSDKVNASLAMANAKAAAKYAQVKIQLNNSIQ
jgi:outer membrane protein TolC